MNTINVRRRFFEKVSIDKDTECWNWVGGVRTVSGYGAFRFNGRQNSAHRVSWILHNGTIPDGLFVLHKCDNPACVNPSHLFLGTAQDNSNDMKNKGRSPRGERHGSHLHPERIARGEENGNSKLTEKEVLEIRRLFASGKYRKIELSRKFGVDHKLIERIINREIWVHIK